DRSTKKSSFPRHMEAARLPNPAARLTIMERSIDRIGQDMDATDQRLITILRHDGRRSLSDLAAELGLTRATVRARLERLKNSGEIIGFTVILRSDAIDLPVRGIMMIEIGGHSADAVIKALNGFSEVSAIHTTNGKWDLVVELGTSDLIDFV